MHIAIRSISIAFSVALGALSLSACGADATSPSPEQEVPEDETFTRTVVVLEEDGTETVTVEQVSAADLKAETALREQVVAANGKVSLPITHDTGCAWSSLWLQDQTNQGGNRICFYGAGSVSLASYCRIFVPPSSCLANWSGAVRSYYSGLDVGRLADAALSCCGSCTSFPTMTQVDNASTCEQNAPKLILGTYCNPC